MPGDDASRHIAELVESGLAPETPCVLISRAGLAGQQTMRTTLLDMANLPKLPAPSLLILAEVAEAKNGPGHRANARAELPEKFTREFNSFFEIRLGESEDAVPSEQEHASRIRPKDRRPFATRRGFVPGALPRSGQSPRRSPSSACAAGGSGAGEKDRHPLPST